MSLGRAATRERGGGAGIDSSVSYGPSRSWNASGSFDGNFLEIIRPLANEMELAPLHLPSTESYTDDYSGTTNPPATGARYFGIKAVIE